MALLKVSKAKEWIMKEIYIHKKTIAKTNHVGFLVPEDL
jgi:hypothetical protein